MVFTQLAMRNLALDLAECPYVSWRTQTKFYRLRYSVWQASVSLTII